MRTIIALGAVASASATLYSADPVVQKTLWDNFKANFGKKYDTIETENRRFYLFVENLKTADHRNAAETKAGGSAVYGITKFSDISQAEFEAGLLTSDVTMKSKSAPVMQVTRPVDTKSGLVDWRGKYTTAVKDQGQCGSCWAFSATEQVESDAMRTLGTNYILSPEQITQCDRTSLGCNGGWTEHAYEYLRRNGGIEEEASYPYTSSQGVTGTCHVDPSKYVLTVSGYTTIDGEDNMASYVQSTGPLSVCLDAETWNLYTGGVVKVCGNNVDHCVQAVGVEASDDGYWIVRNSWGVNWGEEGYIRLAFGADTCAITSDPTWVSVGKA